MTDAERLEKLEQILEEQAATIVELKARDAAARGVVQPGGKGGAMQTVANSVTDARTASTRGPNGEWVPSPGQKLAATMGVSVLGSTAPAIVATLPAPWNLILGGVMGGAAIGIGTFFGIKSNGTRKPGQAEEG